ILIMEIIDCHLHFSSIELFKKTAKERSKVDYSRIGLVKELEESNIVKCIGMGLSETGTGKFPDADSVNPMRLDLEKIPSGVYSCLGINPVKLKFDRDKKELADIESNISEKVVGLKIYPGYYPYKLTDSCYQQIYHLAEQYQLPVVIHCGDTFCNKGHLSYSHPLEVNKIALQHRDVDFVMAHFGNPWVIDAAMVISNNPNVYADLSGLLIGSEDEINNADQLLINYVKTGFAYVSDYTKFFYGSDWPLVRMNSYISYIKKLIPEDYHQLVFYDNAAKVFQRLKYN
ncbi:MAG: TatD family hydrolase, partial [Bacillota bacterium]|nr:TatD family hydrolase [Bacillota bacterium]